jgi:hypothetical protein
MSSQEERLPPVPTNGEQLQPTAVGGGAVSPTSPQICTQLGKRLIREKTQFASFVADIEEIQSVVWVPDSDSAILQSSEVSVTIIVEVVRNFVLLEVHIKLNYGLECKNDPKICIKQICLPISR